MRFRAFVTLTLTGMLMASPGFAAQEKKTPNIVIILADDLGYGDLGCYNKDSKIPTPHLDQLAKQGMRFTDAHSPSAVCSPTRYGLLTGRYPFRSPLKKGVVMPWGPSIVEAGRLTLPEMLRRVGYRTACIGKWHLGWAWATKDGNPPASGKDRLSNVDFTKAIANGPTAHGFDQFFGVDVPNFPPYCFIDKDRTVGIPSEPSRPEFNRPGPMLPGWQWVDVLPELSRRSVAFIDDAAKKSPRSPFFLYVPLTSPHYPVVPTKAFQGKSKAGDYGDFVAQSDAVVGEILNALERSGVADNTIVIFTSDNGPEVVGEVGVGAYERLRRFGHASMGRLRGVKRDLWEGGHRVPFLIRWPGKIAPGSTSDATIAHSDLMATFAALLKAPLPNDAAEDSVDVSAAFRGEKVARESLVHGSGSGRLALRQGDWVFIASPSGQDNGKVWGEPAWFREERGYNDPKQPYQLFNLRDDPTQKVNRYADDTERAAKMLKELERIQREGRSVHREKAQEGRESKQTAADEPVREAAARTSLANPAVKFVRADKPYVVLKRADIEMIVVDNSAVDDDTLPKHHAGYSGVGSLKHAKRPTNFFVPTVAGLNFEHILDGSLPKDRKTQFEPRNWPMELRIIDEHAVELYQAPTFHHGLESCQRYELLDDGAIQLTMEVIPRKKSFTNGYISLFWASYIHQPDSLDIHFRGFPRNAARPGTSSRSPWVRGVTPSHGQLSSHTAAADRRLFTHEEPFPLTLVYSLSDLHYSEPWYFGVNRDMALVQMFRPGDRVRLTQSPSGGGKGNPAWDFQYFIENYEVDRRYQFVMRAMLVPYESHEQIENATRGHRAALGG